MFFYHGNVNDQNSIERIISLGPNLYAIINPQTQICQRTKNNAFPKRTSQRLPGSATVEAACIVPLLIFFFISFIWMLDLFTLHAKVGNIVTCIGREMTAYSYPYQCFLEGSQGEDNSLVAAAIKIGFTEAGVRKKIRELPESDRIEDLTLLLSDLDESDEIDIVATYYVRPYLEIPGLKGVILTNHFHSAAFTGYERTENAGEMVYITRTGTVYHTSLDCQALKVTILSVPFSGVEERRNEEGASYYPCELCASQGTGTSVYITPYGNRYHFLRECSALKTDVFEVPLSDVSDRRKCKFCK